jgi:uncharacterized protein YabN with tetrapyrrole methylase and pyrophosphatase domain
VSLHTKKDGKQMGEMSLTEMDHYWKKAKQINE